MVERGLAVRVLQTGVIPRAMRGQMTQQMSQEKPNDDPRQRTDWGSKKQTDKPWKGPAEKEQKPGGPPPDLERWHKTNTH